MQIVVPAFVRLTRFIHSLLLLHLNALKVFICSC